MPRFAEPVRAPPAKKSASRPAAVRPPARRLAPAQQAALSRVLQLRAREKAGAARSPETANRDGLPDRLKAGVEALSGLAMDDVRVHRNSAEPAKLGALAYTRGSDIHLGPGQEQHLPHEAWHVVQQKQGRVRPTLQMKGAGINADPALEHEADAMGGKAATGAQRIETDARPRSATLEGALVIQGNWIARLFGAFRRLPKETLAKTRIVPSGTVGYRIDSRSPSEIRQSGFWPRAIRLPMEEITAQDIQRYQISNVHNPGVVSTADTREAALVFARQLGASSPGTKYIYRVSLGGLVEFPQSENIPWWKSMFYSEQQETMIAGGIAPDRTEPDGEIEVSPEDAAVAEQPPPGQ